MSEPPGDAAAAIKLSAVRTIADASAWLRVRAGRFAAAENLARSPADAKGFGLAASTIEGLAELLGMTDAKTAAGTLLTMGTDYAHAAKDEAVRREPAYWRACAHLASTCGVLGAQLSAATRPRSGPSGTRPTRDTDRQL